MSRTLLAQVRVVYRAQISIAAQASPNSNAMIMVTRFKFRTAGTEGQNRSHSDARLSVELIRETHKFIAKKLRGVLDDQTQERNAANPRIGFESILTSCSVSTSVDATTTQRNALFSVVLWTGLYSYRLAAHGKSVVSVCNTAKNVGTRLQCSFNIRAIWKQILLTPGRKALQTYGFPTYIPVWEVP